MDNTQWINSFLSTVIQAILVVALPILTNELARYVRARITALEKQHPEDIYKIIEISSVVVRAAEQMYRNGQIQDRLAYALEAGERMLRRYGIELDLDELKDLIEAEVSVLPKSE